MKYLLATFVFGCALSLQAQTEMNVDQLAQVVRSELALKQHTDKQIAAYLKKEVKLTEKLTDKTIEDLEQQGAGPRTVDALHALRDQTANLKPPTHDATYSPATAPEAPINTGPSAVRSGFKSSFPPPNSVRQQEILEQIKQYAMNYAENLPNFICLQVTRQYVDPNSTDYFHLIQTINAQLSYHEGQEEHRVISINGKLANIGFEQVSAKTGGAISTGEFGQMIKGVFEDKSQAQIGWDHWGTWDGKLMAVFNYYIDSGHSEYRITDVSSHQEIITAYRGLVYADQYTGEIARITLEAVNVPSSFPVQEASETLTFGDTEINGQKYNMPLKAELRMRSGRQKDKNDIEFRLYRKFGTESNIVYGAEAPPPLADNQVQDTPPANAAPSNSAARNQPGQQQQQQPAQAATQKKSSDPWALPAPPPPPPQ